MTTASYAKRSWPPDKEKPANGADRAGYQIPRKETNSIPPPRDAQYSQYYCGTCFDRVQISEGYIVGETLLCPPCNRWHFVGVMVEAWANRGAAP